jgi:hypothetical protein
MIVETGACIAWSFERNIVGLWQKRQRRRVVACMLYNKDEDGHQPSRFENSPADQR